MPSLDEKQHANHCSDIGVAMNVFSRRETKKRGLNWETLFGKEKRPRKEWQEKTVTVAAIRAS